MTMQARFWAEAPARFLANIDQSGGPTACWPWRGALTRHGYGSYHMEKAGSPQVVHREVYKLLVGPIPVGLTLDHLCRNRACVNPAHLEPVSIRENVLRGYGAPAVNARRVTCIRGHSDWGPVLSRPGRRFCRMCHRLSNAARPRAFPASPAKGFTEPSAGVGSHVAGVART